MKFFPILFPVMLLLTQRKFSCSHADHSAELSAFTVSNTLPIVNWDGSMTVLSDKYDVYYYGDQVMYQFYYNFDSTVNGKLLLKETRKEFFLLHKDSVWGYRFDPNPYHIVPDSIYLLDSIMKNHSFTSHKYDTLLKMKPDTVFTKDGEIQKVYSPPTSDSFPEKFRLTFHYRKGLNSLKETFSVAMDNVPEMKLSKISIYAPGMFYKQYNMTFPPREYVMEMKELAVENKEEILGYFEKYQKNNMSRSAGK